MPLTVGVAAHKTYPSWLSLQNHQDGKVDDTRGEGCAATNKCTESHDTEGLVGVMPV